MVLEKYTAKRDFGKTSEPVGQKHEHKKGDLIFVVQEHHAKNLHWDFRLEHEEVLASWAVPKGPPKEFNEKKLAVQVEDHPFKYKDFEGDIPKDQYGGGHVDIWDKGTYIPIKWDKDVIEVVLSGEKMSGRYSLVKTRGYAKNSWLLIKNKPKDISGT